MFSLVAFVCLVCQSAGLCGCLCQAKLKLELETKAEEVLQLELGLELELELTIEPKLELTHPLLSGHRARPSRLHLPV